MNEISLKSINQTGMIITLSREIESLMTKLGATNAGLHDKTDYLASRLPPECVKLLHYIAAVRNKNAHESVDFEEIDMELFSSSCESVMFELRKLLPEEEQKKLTISSVPLVNHDVVDIERHFSDELKTFFRVCAFIPFLNVVYLMFGLFRVVAPALDKIIGIIFFLMSAIIIVGGIVNKNKHALYMGLILYGVVYLYGIILSFLQREEIKLHRGFAFMPILNLGFFIYGSYIRISMFKFSYFLLLLLSYVVGIIAYSRYSKLEISFWIMSSVYILGMLTALFDTISQKNEKKLEKESKTT